MGRIKILSTVRERFNSRGKRKPLSQSEFAQHVVSQLHDEIDKLSRKNEAFWPPGVFQKKLAAFQTYLMALGDAPDSNDTTSISTALNLLERLCKASYFIFYITLILPWRPIFACAFQLEAPDQQSVKIPINQFTQRNNAPLLHSPVGFSICLRSTDYRQPF